MASIKTSKRRKATRLRKAESYWTKSRMRSAEPIPFPTVSRGMLKRSIKKGVTRIVPPIFPRSAKKRALAETDEVADMSKFPFSYVGKLFMREGANNYVGSAWVIGESAIFSAAHCLFDDNGTFFDDVVFRPQFKEGSSPETFAVTQMSIDSRYAEFEDDHLNFDLGIATLDRPISHLTGVAGYAVNPMSQIAVGNTVTGIGYPAGAPFDGTRMFKSKGKIVRDSDSGTTTERFFGAENEMTGGCSGGPWVDQNNVAIGLNSFVFVGEDPPIMHSPYFGEGFEDLIDWAKGKGAIGSPSDTPEDEDDSFDSGSIRDDLADVINALDAIRDRIS